MFERARYIVNQIDPEIFAAIQQENQRQEDHIERIASENHTSPAMMAVQCSQLTNKYAEGYPKPQIGAPIARSGLVLGRRLARQRNNSNDRSWCRSGNRAFLKSAIH